jgi:hypothetical protein
MFKLVKREMIKVTADVAEKFLKKNIYCDQRLLRPMHVKELESYLENGTFTTGNIAISRNIFDGNSEVLVNGQHQCNAVINSGIPMVALYEQYECKEPTDISLLYTMIDNHGARSLSNVAKPEANALGLTWGARIVSKMITAAIMIENMKRGLNICSNRMVKSEKVGLLQYYIKDGEFVNKILTFKQHGERPKHLMRGVVIAAMILTWRKDNYNAEKFWELIRDGERLTSEMPMHKLRDFLMQVSVSRGRGSSTGKQLVSEHEIITKCITAWNAFKRGDSTSLRYFPDKPIPKIIS